LRITPGIRVGYVFVLSLALATPSRAQEAPLGVVQQANRAHVQQSAVSEGATVYPGEELTTESGGSLQLRIGTSRFGLLENGRASFYPGARGSIAELRDGTLTFRKEAEGAGMEIVASDVRVVPKGDGAVTGQVTIVGPCNITVTSVTGQLDVTSGTETKTVNEKESYAVVPEVSVTAAKAFVSPEDPTYHQSHNHQACRPARKWGGSPISPGASHFFYLAAGGAAIATIIGIWKASESPDHP
jgi:hypothetical protein